MKEETFSCTVEDPFLKDLFSAQVKVICRDVSRVSRDGKNLELADVLITPVSGQFAYYNSKDTWDKKPAQFNVPTRENSGSHNHFIVYDLNGWGLYIVRDQMRREVHRRECVIWDLGHPLAIPVMRLLREPS